MAEIYLQVWFEGDSLSKLNIGRSLYEDALDEALEASGLGEIIGGGSGVQGSDIAIAIPDEHNFQPALELVRAILQENNAPVGTTIIKGGTDHTVYNLDK